MQIRLLFKKTLSLQALPIQSALGGLSSACIHFFTNKPIFLDAAPAGAPDRSIDLNTASGPQPKQPVSYLMTILFIYGKMTITNRGADGTVPDYPAKAGRNNPSPISRIP
jgi:hypothetical protein